MRARLAAAVVVLASSSYGCIETCDRPESDTPRPYKGGEIIGDTYMSSDWDGDLLHFPGGAYYEIHHDLGVKPVGFRFYLSFERSGSSEASVAQAAGNQAEMKYIDDKIINVVNGSCSEYYLLVTAWRDGEGGQGGDGGQGGQGGQGGN
jgi:hypothetical protein